MLKAQNKTLGLRRIFSLLLCYLCGPKRIQNLLTLTELCQIELISSQSCHF